MTLVSTSRVRRKAVWGPKGTALALLLIMVGLAPNAIAAKQKHHQGPRKASSVPGAHAENYRLDRELTRRADDLSARTTRVIVTLVPGAQVPAEFKRYVSGGRLDIINGQVLDLPNSVLKKLAAHPDVFRVHFDRPIGAHNYRTSITVGANVVQQSLGYTGAGIGIAIIDSGVTTWHDDLTGSNLSSTKFPYGNQRVRKFVDFVAGHAQPYDDNGHGTHVAGIIAGNGYDSSGQKSGIAPGANLVVLKVLDGQGKGTISNIIAALNWIAANGATYNIRVVNMSVGAGVYESFLTDPLTLAAKAVTDKGITVVAAAGNMGKNAAGQLQWGGITAPGNAPWVLTVGASSTMGTLTRNDDQMADYSSSGPTYIDYSAKPDLVAPGTGTISLAAPGSLFYATKTQFLVAGTLNLGLMPYLSLSGTSMAAPVVSGTVALMLQANPGLTPNLIKAILQYTSQVYPGYSALRQGAGFLNTLGAVRLASFYKANQSGAKMPVQKIWSKTIIWGNHQLTGGYLKPTANAWATNVIWGTAKTLGDTGDNVVWGTACADCDNIVWGTADALDNIVWGTAGSDNIVWGTANGDDNIVWGTDCGGNDCDNIVWGTVDAVDNVVWGTADALDNIVWGTAGFDNIVWGTSANDPTSWASDAGDDNLMFSDDAGQPLPDPGLEFGDFVPLLPGVPVNPLPTGGF